MSEQREALAEAREYHRHGDSIDLVPGAAETCVYIKSEPRDMLALAPDTLARLLADAEQRGADRVAAAVEAVVARMGARQVDHWHEDEVGHWGVQGRAYFYAGDIYDDYTDLRAALTPGAADRVLAEEGGDRG